MLQQSHSEVVQITSRDNVLIKALRKLAQDSAAYRKQQRVWLEGDHLCRAAQIRGIPIEMAIFSESFWASSLVDIDIFAPKKIVVPDALFATLSGLESPARMAAVVALPAEPLLKPGVPTVVLDRVQDAGNVGSILRSASAFGFQQVIALKGGAALWAPKVIRAGMGAHFGLHLIEGMASDVLESLSVPIVVTSSHQGDYLHQANLPWPCAWVLGHEGQGISPHVQKLARHYVRIGQPGGEESLNVAAAAAICLHASGVLAP